MPRQLEFFVPGRDLASILVASARYQALPGALSGVPARPWRLSGRSWGVSGTARDAPETPPERSWAAWGAPKGSQDQFLFFCVALATPFEKKALFRVSRPTPSKDRVGRLTRNKAVCQSVWPVRIQMHMEGPAQPARRSGPRTVRARTPFELVRRSSPHAMHAT